MCSLSPGVHQRGRADSAGPQQSRLGTGLSQQPLRSWAQQGSTVLERGPADVHCWGVGTDCFPLCCRIHPCIHSTEPSHQHQDVPLGSNGDCVDPWHQGTHLWRSDVPDLPPTRGLLRLSTVESVITCHQACAPHHQGVGHWSTRGLRRPDTAPPQHCSAGRESGAGRRWSPGSESSSSWENKSLASPPSQPSQPGGQDQGSCPTAPG